MKKVVKYFPNTIKYPLSTICDIKTTIFFDIETTGLSSKTSNLYLIGAIFFNKSNQIELHQWFADTLSDEVAILESFFSMLTSFTTLISFNGDRFDLPYLSQLATSYYIDSPLSHMHSIDLFKQIRPLKKWLHTEKLNQKSLEKLIGLSRADIYSGRELISFYISYCDTQDVNILDILLLHNEEDLRGMLQITDLLLVYDFLRSDFLLDAIKIDAVGKHLTLTFSSPVTLPTRLHVHLGEVTLFADKNILELYIILFEGELKYFYSNYKDYIYLPLEDMAIHTSIGNFVEKSAKQKATKENAYTKKDSLYIPIYESFSSPIFKSSYKSKQAYIEYPVSIDAIFALSYLQMILKKIK